jgi:hypothetical protein
MFAKVFMMCYRSFVAGAVYLIANIGDWFSAHV